ncbi:MAG: hypothetical protein ACRDY5_00925, partial [Acidimicrobiales bacterium]
MDGIDRDQPTVPAGEARSSPAAARTAAPTCSGRPAVASHIAWQDQLGSNARGHADQHIAARDRQTDVVGQATGPPAPAGQQGAAGVRSSFPVAATHRLPTTTASTREAT